MNALWWYTARAAGIVAWALLAASMIWGLALSTKALGKRPRPNWLLDLHRFLGGAALVFVGIHIASIMLDSYVDFGVVEVVVPFASTWDPGAVAWGIAGFYLLVAVEITSLLRKRIGKRIWRMTHVLSFPLFAATTVHTLLAGSDASGIGLRLLLSSATLVIVGMTAIRVFGLQGRSATPRHCASDDVRRGQEIVQPARSTEVDSTTHRVPSEV